MATRAVIVRRWRWRRIAREVASKLLVLLIVLPLAGFIAMPFLWMLGSSFKPIGSGIRFPPQFIPSKIVTTNYPLVFQTIPFFLYMRNSVIVTGGVIVGEVLSACVVAYSFARLRFPGRDVWFIVLLATMMIPYPVTMVPTFILFKLIHWVDTYLPLIVPAWFAPPFAVFLMRQFFMTVNRELDDAAKVDGCTEWRIFLAQKYFVQGIVTTGLKG